MAIDNLVVTTEVTPVSGKYSLYQEILHDEVRLEKFTKLLRKARKIKDLERRRTLISTVRKKTRLVKKRLNRAEQLITATL